MSGVRIPPPRPFMVAVAQLVERRIVTPVAAGSIPVSHPILVLPHSPPEKPAVTALELHGSHRSDVANAPCRRVFLPNVLALKSVSWRKTAVLMRYTIAETFWYTHG